MTDPKWRQAYEKAKAARNAEFDTRDPSRKSDVAAFTAELNYHAALLLTKTPDPDDKAPTARAVEIPSTIESRHPTTPAAAPWVPSLSPTAHDKTAHQPGGDGPRTRATGQDHTGAGSDDAHPAGTTIDVPRDVDTPEGGTSSADAAHGDGVTRTLPDVEQGGKPASRPRPDFKPGATTDRDGQGTLDNAGVVKLGADKDGVNESDNSDKRTDTGSSVRSDQRTGTHDEPAANSGSGVRARDQADSAADSDR